LFVVQIHFLEASPPQYGDLRTALRASYFRIKKDQEKEERMEGCSNEERMKPPEAISWQAERGSRKNIRRKQRIFEG
jgi:hypothetical protein